MLLVTELHKNDRIDYNTLISSTIYTLTPRAVVSPQSELEQVIDVGTLQFYDLIVIVMLKLS